MKNHIQRYFPYFLGLILVFSTVIRLLPLRGNNFYFTMDQGNDAVHVRKLNYQHRLLLRGTETGIPGLHTGPGWYWLTSTGFLISNNHPVGPIILLIIVNLTTTFLLIKYLKEKINTSIALLIGIGLQFFWPYYDITRYAFNPFLLVPLSFLLIILLIKALDGNEKSLILAAIPVGAAFHFEIAAFIAWGIFYFLIIAHLLYKRTIKLKTTFFCLLVLSLFFLPTLIYEINHDFRQTNAVIHHFQGQDSVISATQFKKMASIFADLLNQGTVSSRTLIINVILIIVTIYFAKKSRSTSKSASRFAFSFLYLTLVLFVISYFWFGSSMGWQTWHTIYLPPLIFISLLLINLVHPNKIGLTIVGLIILSQSFIFVKNYSYFFKPNEDPSLLVNELKAIDWAYSQTENKSLSVYTSIPSVEDYNYQYLIWWWGLKKYGFLPCEYNTYPNAPKTYLPKGYQIFEKPKGSCPSKVRVLIMEPDKNNTVDSEWYYGVTKNTDLLANTKVGKIKLEKRLIK